MQTKIEINNLLPELIDFRRHLHAHPELSGHEIQTAALVSGELRKCGWIVSEGVGRTGIVASLGPTNGPIVGIRVDMDALPVEERTNLPFSSVTQGIMHACGHDVHTTIGLGVGQYLSSISNLKTGVRLIFQPAEEIAKGASWMMKDGATKDLDALFGVHAFPELSVGHIGLRDGSLTAAAGELEIEIIGNGGHGARPHETVDSIFIASKIVTGIQEGVTRCFDALDPIVISFGKISGGNAFNVLPDRVKLLGTVRCLDDMVHKKLISWLEDISKSIATTFGGNILFKYRCIAPPVQNDPKLNALIEEAGVALLGRNNVHRLPKPSLGAEDFAVFLQEVPGAMFRLGVAGTEGCAPLHNGEFCPEEKSIEIGVQIIIATIFAWMDQQAS